ncbi:MAG: hypothetical protein IT160_10730 [Bryobacterales bacterium]|nr:hypothetical protein [Bryobacterales bacterium]
MGQSIGKQDPDIDKQLIHGFYWQTVVFADSQSANWSTPGCNWLEPPQAAPGLTSGSCTLYEGGGYMAGRGSQTFQKRQKEQQRREKQQEKMAKRLTRKHTPLNEQPLSEPLSEDSDLEFPSTMDRMEEEQYNPA